MGNDVVTNAWIDPMATGAPSKRGSSVCTFDQRTGKLMLYGGVTQPSGTPTGQAWEYNPILRQWRQLAPSPNPGNLTFAGSTYSPGVGGMFFFGSVLAVVMTAQLFFSEMDNKTALTLLAKPLSRAEFLLGKFFGAWAVLGVFVVVLASLLGAVLWAREIELVAAAEQAGKIPTTFSAGGLVEFVLLQWLRLGVVTAIVLALSSLARTFLFAVVVGALAVVAGQLQWIAQDAVLKPTDSVIYEAFLWVSCRLIPNLQQFNIGDALVLGSAGVPTGAVVTVAFSGFFYMAAYLFVGALIFRRREI